MGIEIEHKFLVVDDSWREQSSGRIRLRQGYVETVDATTVRVRVIDERSAFLTIKGPSTGNTRAEFEYEIPLTDGQALLVQLCGNLVEKTRHFVQVHAHEWVVDEFDGMNSGLMTAEVELSTPDESFDVPEWAGADVTEDYRYSNSQLAACPYSQWGDRC
jgi:adenylate cyclase